MSIRAKLYFLVILFGSALLINFVVLWLLVRAASTSLTTADTVLQQQSTAVLMQAQLRDAEAALYRYGIEGETGFATHFKDQLNRFEEEIDSYEGLVGDEQERIWVSELRDAHNTAVEFGSGLIEQRNLQNSDLRAIESIQDKTSALLVNSISPLKPDDLAYQENINGMSLSVRDVLLALTSYLNTPREIDRVRFIDSVSTFRAYQAQFSSQSMSAQEDAWGNELAVAIDDIELLGSQLISGRTQQKADFANFALLLFRVGQGIIVDEIQPEAAANIAQAQADLEETIRYSLILSLFTAVLTASVFGAVTFPLLRGMNKSIFALLSGADSVAEGDLKTTVTVDDQYEFKRLATAFNKMTEELSARENRLHELIQKLALVQEEERRLVGLDLHDGLTQMLLSAHMHFNAFDSKFRHENGSRNGSGTADAQLLRGRTRLQEAIDEVRWVVSELRPTELEDYGLVDGIYHYVEKVANIQNWFAEVEVDLGENDLTPAAETAIFRIVQEALSNARKYAHTDRIQVSLSVIDDQLHLFIKDWGQGFEIDGLNRSGTTHLGVIGMEERANLIGGTFDIESQNGKGTTIQICIPLPENLKTQDRRD